MSGNGALTNPSTNQGPRPAVEQRSAFTRMVNTDWLRSQGVVYLILLVVVVVFGSKRLPDTARSLGRSMRILKAETQGLRDDAAPQVTAAAPALFDAEGRPVALPEQVHRA